MVTGASVQIFIRILVMPADTHWEILDWRQAESRLMNCDSVINLALKGVEIVDGYDPLMYARSVKTRQEIGFLQRATRLNQMAIERTVSAWSPGMSWRELNQTYHQTAVELGGFVRDPGAMVWGHPRGGDAAITLQTGLEDFEVETGLHILVRLPRNIRLLLLGWWQDLGGGQ